MQGIFNSWPPKPTYSSIQDIIIVILNIDSRPPNDSLSLKQLSAKLAMLMAICNADRSSLGVHQDIAESVLLPQKNVTLNHGSKSVTIAKLSSL